MARIARLHTLWNLTVWSLLLVPGLMAQARHVLPPALAQTEADSFTNVPFGRSVPMRQQAAYENIMFQGAVTATALAWRLDENLTTAGKTVELEIQMSTLRFGITSIQATFATNTGPDVVTVFQRRMFNLPAHATGSRPNPFHAVIPLDVSFHFAAAPATALLVDTIVHGQPPGGFTLDATFLCDSPQVPFGAPGCGPAAGPALQVVRLTNPILWGRSFVMRVQDAKGLATTALLLGSQESGSWNGLTLPFDLGVIGAPGCALNTDPLVTFAQLADPLGSADYTFFIPSLPYLQGDPLRFQGIALDPSANALGVVSSQGARVVICGYDPVARVYASGAAPTTGAREIGVAPVLELTVQ